MSAGPQYVITGVQPWFTEWINRILPRYVKNGTAPDYAFVKFMACCAIEVKGFPGSKILQSDAYGAYYRQAKK